MLSPNPEDYVVARPPSEIRDATEADIPVLLGMGERFAAHIGLADTIGYDPETMASLFSTLINAPNGILLIMDGGAAGGMVHPALFNASHVTGQELFWWVDSDKRGGGLRLFTALEAAARALGADSWMVSTMEALNFDGATRLYERRGYLASDRNFLKVF